MIDALVTTLQSVHIQQYDRDISRLHVSRSGVRPHAVREPISGFESEANVATAECALSQLLAAAVRTLKSFWNARRALWKTTDTKLRRSKRHGRLVPHRVRDARFRPAAPVDPYLVDVVGVLVCALPRAKVCGVDFVGTPTAGNMVDVFQDPKSDDHVWQLGADHLPSLNGAVDVDVWAYLVVVIQVYCIPQRISSWRLSHGLFCIRGGMIGLLSSLTITAYLRMPGFRNTDVFAAHCVSFESLRIQRQFSLSEEGGTEFGFYFDLRMIAAVTLVLLSATIDFKALAALTCGSVSRLLRRRMPALGGVICSKSTLTPYSTGNLASLMAMSLIWKMTVQHDPEDHPQELRLPSLASPGPRRTWEALFATKYYDRPMPRPDEVQSDVMVVQLVNIALLTELLVLVKLYVVGQALYLYQVKDPAKSILDNDDAKNSQSFFLLPCDLMTLAQNTTVDGGLNSSIYELVEIVDSRTVPWRLMVFCG